MDDIELPKFVNLKINTALLDDEEKIIISSLYVSDRKKLPFQLPPLTKWPVKSKSLGERALILLKKGYLSLIEEKEVKNPIKIEEKIRF